MRVTSFQSAEFAIAPGHADSLLGTAIFGLSDITAPNAWPILRVRAPLLGATSTLAGDAWFGDSACHSGRRGNIRFRQDRSAIFGVVNIDESAFATAAPDTTPLQAATAAAYTEIFTLLATEGFPHLWRTWNYLPAINAESHGIERYRQFNIGRHQAFVTDQRAPAGSPAACAIGVASGPLSIAFLAGRVAPLAIENPRQISAYAYPSDYGPRSPTFSRAVLVRLPVQELLLISGTASIVGHRTAYAGHAMAQCEESLINIGAVIEQANRVSATPFRLEELSFRAYVRHADDLPAVRAVVARRLGAATSVSYVQADICRADLLVEFEAQATHLT